MFYSLPLFSVTVGERRTVVQLFNINLPADVSSEMSLPSVIKANSSPLCAYFAVLAATPLGDNR